MYLLKLAYVKEYKVPYFNALNKLRRLIERTKKARRKQLHEHTPSRSGKD